jgi:hypothetical protein
LAQAPRAAIGAISKPCNNDQGEFLNGFELLISDDFCSMVAIDCPAKL